MEQSRSLPEQEVHNQFLDVAQMASENIIQLFGNVGTGTSYSPPIKAAGYTIITAAEAFVLAGSGLGGGFGTPPARTNSGKNLPGRESEMPSDPSSDEFSGGGGGGGGLSFSRPVATIVIDQDSVEVKPVIDWTKIGLAFLTTIGAMVFMLLRLIRGVRRW